MPDQLTVTVVCRCCVDNECECDGNSLTIERAPAWLTWPWWMRLQGRRSVRSWLREVRARRLADAALRVYHDMHRQEAP